MEGLARVMIDPDKCDGCGECVRLCPFGSLTLNGKARQSGPCYLCGGCEALCEAITLIPLLEVKEVEPVTAPPRGGRRPREGR